MNMYLLSMLGCIGLSAIVTFILTTAFFFPYLQQIKGEKLLRKIKQLGDLPVTELKELETAGGLWNEIGSKIKKTSSVPYVAVEEALVENVNNFFKKIENAAMREINATETHDVIFLYGLIEFLKTNCFERQSQNAAQIILENISEKIDKMMSSYIGQMMTHFTTKENCKQKSDRVHQEINLFRAIDGFGEHCNRWEKVHDECLRDATDEFELPALLLLQGNFFHKIYANHFDTILSKISHMTPRKLRELERTLQLV